MLEDRDYMRSGDGPRVPLGLTAPVNIILIIALIVAFALQQIALVYSHFPVYQYLALSADGLRQGYVWQLITFQFLHGGRMHLVYNLLALWFFAGYVEERLGKLNFLKLYFLSGIAGGILQSLLGFVFPMHFGFPTVGASAGIYGIVAAYATLSLGRDNLAFFHPAYSREISALCFGRRRLVFYDCPAEPGIAHAAHLGGMLFGVAYIRWGRTAGQTLSPWRHFQSRRRKRELVKAASIKPGKLRRLLPKTETPVDLMPDEFITKEVDPILDKISAHGIQSLTDREREILQNCPQQDDQEVGGTASFATQRSTRPGQNSKLYQ